MKELVCRYVPHNWTQLQKAEHVVIYKETLKLLINIGHHIITEFETGDEMGKFLCIARLYIAARLF